MPSQTVFTAAALAFLTTVTALPTQDLNARQSSAFANVYWFADGGCTVPDGNAGYGKVQDKSPEHQASLTSKGWTCISATDYSSNVLAVSGGGCSVSFYTDNACVNFMDGQNPTTSETCTQNVQSVSIWCPVGGRLSSSHTLPQAGLVNDGWLPNE